MRENVLLSDWPIVRSVMIVFLLMLCAVDSWANTSVWKVEKSGQYFYLAGTMHVLKAGDYPLPKAFDWAYQQSDKLVLEVDLSRLDQSSFQKKLMGQGFYASAENLKTQLNAKAWSALSDYCQQRGIAVNAFLTLPTGIVVTQIAMLELQRLGIDQQGVDAYMMNKALVDKKPIQGLESLDEQIDFLLAMGKGDESNFILQNLDELKTLAVDIDALRQAWRKGDMSKIDELMIVGMKKDYPKVYRQILLQRNFNWLPKLQSMIESEDVEYVLVGAAHIAGKDGLLDLLTLHGFTIEQVKK